MKGKRLISMLFAAALAVGLVPATALAAEPITTDLVIHKMQVETGTGLEDHDGTEIGDFTGTNLEGATPLAGIIFKYWTISSTATPAQLAEIRGLSTIADIEGYATANPTVLTGGTETAASDASGVVNVAGLAEGKYLFGEVNGASENVSEYIGVPFLLELPQMKTDGTAYFGTGADALHVYPKNVKKMPGLDVETVNDSNTRIGGGEFLVQKYNTATASYETVTGIGNGGTIALPNGLITLSELPAGQYRLVNTVAPTGYVVDDRPVGFTVSAGVVSFDSPNSPMASFTPASGSANPMITIKFSAKPDVSKTEGSGGTEQIGETVTWTVTMDVPSLIKDYKKFVMTDTIDTRLDYLANSVVAKVGAVTLVENTNYTVDYNTATRVLTVAFAPATLEAYEGQKIEVSYGTKINETAVMGEEIPNNVELSFDNNYGHITEPGEIVPPVVPTVWTGGAKFKKVDGSNTAVALEGAEFKIATNAAGTTFLTWTQDLMDANVLANFVSPVVGGDITLKSGTDGVFGINGLKGGTYYLVETKAPSHNGTQYNLLKDPAPFEITKTSHEDANTMQVLNNSGLQIPQTGGIGTALFTIVGITLMGVAIALFRKKKGSAAIDQ